MILDEDDLEVIYLSTDTLQPSTTSLQQCHLCQDSGITSVRHLKVHYILAHFRAKLGLGSATGRKSGYRRCPFCPLMVMRSLNPLAVHIAERHNNVLSRYLPSRICQRLGILKGGSSGIETEAVDTAAAAGRSERVSIVAAGGGQSEAGGCRVLSVSDTARMARVYVRLQRIPGAKDAIRPGSSTGKDVKLPGSSTGEDGGMVVPSNRTDGAPAGSVSDPGPFVRVRIGKKSGLEKSGTGSMKKRPKTVSTSKKNTKYLCLTFSTLSFFGQVTSKVKT